MIAQTLQWITSTINEIMPTLTQTQSMAEWYRASALNTFGAPNPYSEAPPEPEPARPLTLMERLAMQSTQSSSEVLPLNTATRQHCKHLLDLQGYFGVPFNPSECTQFQMMFLGLVASGNYNPCNFPYPGLDKAYILTEDELIQLFALGKKLAMMFRHEWNLHRNGNPGTTAYARLLNLARNGPTQPV